MKKVLFSLLAIMLFWSMSFAGVDKFNQSVTIEESFSSVSVTFQFTFIDSSDAHHTVPIFIADCNNADAWAGAKQSATGDANVIFHLTACGNIISETAIWTNSTPAGLDATSSTAKFDTLGHEVGLDVMAFHNARWMIIEVVGGGTSNADNNVFTITVSMTKEGVLENNAQPIKVCRTASRSYNNP